MEVVKALIEAGADVNISTLHVYRWVKASRAQ